MHANIFDSSGVTLTFLPENRAVDAGMMRLNAGVLPSQRDPIPPGQAEFWLSPFIVPPQCTSSMTDDLTVLTVWHHAHLVATRVNVDVIRNGISLGPIRRERVYDFNHQSLEPTGFTTVKPGDQFTM